MDIRKWRLVAVVASSVLCGCTDSALDPESVPTPSLAEAGGRHTVVVNPDANGGGTAATIREGIAMVTDGGRVLVVAGTYDERITIDKSLTLESIGTGAGPVIIQQVLATPPASGREAVITVSTAAPVVIRDVTVKHQNVRGLNILFTAADVIIERVSFQGSWLLGPPALNNGVSAANNAAQSGGRVRLAVLDSRFAVDGNAISIGGDVDARIERNAFLHAASNAGCVFVSPIGQGVTVPAGERTNVEILNNAFDDCGANALQKGVTAINVLGTLGAATTGEINIMGNTFRTSVRTSASCNTAAIGYEFFSGRIERNSLVNVVQECATPSTRTLPAAIFVGSRLAGMRAAEVSLRFNDIVGNAFAGLRIGSNQTTPLIASCNWWGDASGPAGAGPGNGDSILLEPGAAAPVFTPFAPASVAATGKSACADGL